MDEINELLESLMIDIAKEGMGTAAGIGLLFGLFLGGTFASFSEVIDLLVSTI